MFGRQRNVRFHFEIALSKLKIINKIPVVLINAHLDTLRSTVLLKSCVVLVLLFGSVWLGRVLFLSLRF